VSLINDALNRARAEAARREGAERGEMPSPGVAPPRDRSSWSVRVPLLILLLVSAAALLVALRGRAPQGTFEATSEHAEASPTQAAVATSAAIAPPAEATAGAAEPSPPLPAAEGAAARPRAAEPETTAAERAATDSEPATDEVPLEPIIVDPAPLPPILVSPSPQRPAAAPRATADTPLAANADATWYYVGHVDLAEGTIELDGIAWSSSAPLAMLNGALLQVGDDILGLEVTAIEPRTVTLVGRGQRIALQLDTEHP
jgi:cytoskeletal protein RodZ